MTSKFLFPDFSTYLPRGFLIDKAPLEVHPSHKGRNSMNSIFAMNAYYSCFYYYRGSCGVSGER